ncbi:MAG: prolipoprotein diacylglyceryl transferase [Candidatus Latescibacteria bacterium]|nr:prolipoprotein diacylglyceryl transferase [Candidatus Latescibacterota bacterium]
MHPILFKLGPLAVRSYGVLLALSFLAGVYVALWRARQRGLDPSRLLTMCLLIVASSIVGARVLYVIPHWEEFIGHPFDIISPVQSSGDIGITGLTMYGGVIAALATSIWYLKRHRQPVWRTADACAPSIALGIGLTRIGCFLNGCCFGLPSTLPWAVTFPELSAAGALFPRTPLHPAQLYSSLYGFALFGALLAVDRRDRYDGFLFALFLMIESVAHFTVDVFRYYEASMTLTTVGAFPISVNQGLCLLLFGMGLFLMLRLRPRRTPQRSRRPARPGRRPTTATRRDR